jgi:LysR family transcriptional regulator, transcriptional activator of nhaA
MDWLNYHHLLYFWTVAREGSLSRASADLHLAPSTVSKQIRQLEEGLGHTLFSREGRRLLPTDVGRVVLRYAEEIFGLGRELQDTLKDRPVGRPQRVSVGVADVVPKLLAQRVLEVAMRPPQPMRLVCREDKPDRLLAELALHNLDVILSDEPAGPRVRVKAFSHLLGEYAVTIFGTAALARRYREGFPACLDGAPLILPTENTVLRGSLDQWMDSRSLRPSVIGEFEDSALLMEFGQRGAGLFPASSLIAAEVERKYRVKAVGTVPGIRERLYAVSVQRRIDNPAVLAICDAARGWMSGPAVRRSGGPIVRATGT